MYQDMNKALLRTGTNVYGVFDGASFRDIQRVFLETNIPARSLFLQSAPADTISAGPWLINTRRNTKVISRVSELAYRSRSGVFWCGDFSEEEIYRHLRRLNVVRKPDDELVYFRHYDPQVFESVAGLLDIDQASIFMGPAETIVLGGDADTFLRELERPSSLAVDTHGMLVFSEYQIDKLNERQHSLFRRKLLIMCRNAFPNSTKSLTDKDLNRVIAETESEGNSIGLTSEDALSKWTYIHFLTEGRSSNNPYLMDFLKRRGPKNINESIDEGFVTIIYDWEISKMQRRQT